MEIRTEDGQSVQSDCLIHVVGKSWDIFPVSFVCFRRLTHVFCIRQLLGVEPIEVCMRFASLDYVELQAMSGVN